MKRLAVLVLLVLAGCGGSSSPPERAAAPAATAPCLPPRLHHTPYPGGDERMASIPWIEGAPPELGLVGLLWYWDPEWRSIERAQVFTGGTAPAGYNAKVLWAFLEPDVFDRAGSELVIEGENLDGPGDFRETFSAISYEGQEGAPSYASILNLPEPGCWRLKLTTGELRAYVDIEAVPPEALAQPCEPERVHYGPGGDVWVEGSGSGLRAHLAYWPERWRGLTRARVYTRGRAPDGAAAKVMWIFHADAALDRGDSQLRLEGRNLQGPGTVGDEFAEVFYEGQNGKPSYASIVDLPRAGCWRLTVETGDLRGSIDIRAVDP